MLNNTKQRTISPTLVATTWLNRQLSSVIDAFHRRLRLRLILTSISVALTTGVGVLAVLSPLGGESKQLGSIDAVLLTVTISVITASVLYAVLRQSEPWLFQAASTISHDNIELFSLLGKLTELRNGETSGHNIRVTTYTLLFAETLGLPPDEIVRTTKGAWLHDVGKLAIPDHILGKPGPLTAEERTQMEEHVNYGLEIISQSHFLQEAALVVGAHHEHYDGTGYPLGLKYEEIPREARLFTMIDVFDALTSVRIYKPALSIGKALAMMEKNSGTHFDPALFERFKSVAPDLARQLPREEAALTALLMNRLSPYLEHLVRVEHNSTLNEVLSYQ